MTGKSRIGWMIGFVAAAAVGATAIMAAVAFLSTSRGVRVESKLRIRTVRPQVVDEHQLDAAEYEMDGNNIVALVGSPGVMERALREPAVSALPLVREQQDPAAWLAAQLDISCEADNGIVTIAMNGSDSEPLIAIVDAVTDAYLEVVVHADRRRRADRLDRLKEIWQQLHPQTLKDHSEVLQLEQEMGDGLSAALEMRKHELSVQTQELADIRMAINRIELRLSDGPSLEKLHGAICVGPSSKTR